MWLESKKLAGLASLVTIIAFLLGLNWGGISNWVSSLGHSSSSTSSVILTPTAVTSSNPTPTAQVTTTIPSASNPETYSLATISQNSSVGEFALTLVFVMMLLSFIIIFTKWPVEKAKRAHWPDIGCGTSMLGFIAYLFAIPGFPFLISDIMYRLLGTIVTTPLTLVLLVNAISYSLCALISYGIRKWMMSLVP